MLRLLLLILCTISFAQNTKISTKILVSDDFKFKEITNNLEYYIDETQNITINDFDKIKNWQIYNNEQFINQYNKRSSNFRLWLRTNFKNTSNDTLNLVVNIDDFRNSQIVIKNQNQLEFKKVGYLIPNNQKDFPANSHSFKLQLLPLQEKQVFINSYVDYLSETGLKITLETQENFNYSIMEKIHKRNSWYSLFGILTGGILLMLFYNIVLFYQYRENNYLYYSAHLLFTFFNYSMIADGLHQDFYGNLNQYRDLMLECSYVLSFIFYSIFVYSVLSDKTKINVKKLFVFYVGFMLFYLVSVIVVFNIDNTDLISNFAYAAFIFRIISCFFGIYIMYVLLKTHKNSYLKYIMYGTLILIISYFTHVIFNLVIGNSIINHYFNLVGTLLEILFFTYALNLRKRLAEQERDVLIKMNEMKSRFFANISHEFRTPLTLIKSPVQSLQAEINDESQIKKLNLIDKNSSRMLELVDQLLELSKLDSGSLQLILKEGNIALFLNSILESFAYQAKESNILFSSNIKKNTKNHYFDKDVIEKIVTNLLSNAIKYTSENEKIAIESKIENNQLQLIVSNSGSDIKKEDLAKLFERFYQKNQTNQGVGIGLALVKELVELYKGKIETKLEQNILSFIIYLPLETANGNALLFSKNEKDYLPMANDALIISNKNSDSELPILLIIDDNKDLRTVLASIFEADYQILEAENGVQGLKIAKAAIPDCIITDVMMPIMDGFEFTKLIKNDELTSFIPVILLTAKSSDQAHLEGLNSTADAYLTKPFNNEIVKATVNQLIAERKKLHTRYSQELVLRPVDIVINSVDEKFLEKLQQILDKEMSNSEFSSDNFASSVGMSRMQLHRKLKSLLGVSATEFLRNERLKTAVVLLEKGNGNISEIAYSVGFNDVSYFSKCFKEVYNVTPSEFLNKKNTL